LPVVNSFIFIFRSLGLSFQEAAIALLGDDLSGYKSLNKFFLTLGGVIVIVLFTIAFSPLLELWYGIVAGLDDSLLIYTELPTRILAIIPFLSLLISFQRAILVKSNNPVPISTATLLEVGGIFLILWLTLYQFNWVGVYGTAIAMLAGRVMANFYLAKKCHFSLAKIEVRHGN